MSTIVTPRKRVLSAVPSHPIYGFLFTVMLPAVMGLLPANVIDLRRSSAAWLSTKVQPGDLVVGHPDYWNEVQRAGVAFPDDVVGVSSGAPCPDDVARQLRLAGLRLVQVFGSSETAGLGWRDNETLPYRCLPYWQPGNDAQTLVRTLPDAGQANFILQDHLTWVDANHFVPTGRRDHVVQVGGVNVLPAKATAVLKEHPDVQDAIVRLMRADEGTRLKAFVVPHNGLAHTDDLANELGRWVGEKLTAPERPATFTFGPQLPKQGNGKPADWII